MDATRLVPFEVALDSGAVNHVADNMEAPGYHVDATSKSTSSFAAASGEPIENKGEMIPNLTTTEGHPVKSKFQVCEVSRPLWSVGKICGAGCTVIFDSKGATIKHAAIGKNLCLFEPRRGLYTANLNSAQPANVPATGQTGFRRQD